MGPLKPWLKSLQTFEQQIEPLFHSHCDADLFATLPGAGPHLAPRLLVALGEDRSRDDSAQDICRYCGIAPVKEKSGKKEWMHGPWGCPTCLRQPFGEWADQSRQHSLWAEAFDEQQKLAGKSHPKAIRSRQRCEAIL